MNVNIFLIVVFLFLVKFSFAQKKRPDISFTIRLVGYNIGRSCTGSKRDTAFCFLLILKNKSKVPVKFGHMTASWWWMFEHVNKGFEYCGGRFNHNFPTTTILNPGKSCANFIFFHKTDPNTNILQLKFRYMEGKKYLSWQHSDGRNVNYPMPDWEYYLSNTCNVVPTNRMMYFQQREFSSYSQKPQKYFE